MSSEEMRVELESFVNAGLREGWRGWPLKEGIFARRVSGLPLHAKMARLWCRRGSGLTASGERLRAIGIVGRFYVQN